MRCPNCGAEVEPDGAPFCPHCGMNLLNRRNKRKLRFILMDVQDGRRFRHLASATVIAIVVVAVLSVLLVEWDEPEGVDPPAVQTGLPDDAIQVSDTSYIIPMEGFDDGTMTVEFTETREFRFELSDSLAQGYDSFTWVLSGGPTGTYLYTTKDTADTNWASPEMGRYTITVECEGDGGTAVYSASFEYIGDRHVQHSFTFDGRTYSVYVDVTLDEYLESSSPSPDRSTASVEEAAGFVVIDDCVTTLSERLRDAYLRANPSEDVSSQRYAEYLVAFVQSCMTDVPDIVSHSMTVYWAHPAETLFWGAGDSGDLAVLTAALLEESGFDSGIAIIHGMTFAVVSMERYTSADAPSGYHVVRVDRDGEYYYLIDAIADVPIGYVPEGYGYSDGSFTYYGSDVSSESGMALVTIIASRNG